MPQVSSQERALRIAVVVGSTVVDERVLRSPRAVTVGSGPTNLIVVPEGCDAATLRLFERTRAGFRLRLPSDLRGRAQVGPEVRELKGGEGAMALDASARGVIYLGAGARLLFQVVRVPAEPALGAAERRLLQRGPRLDRVFAGAVLTALAANYGAVQLLSLLPHAPSDVAFEELPPQRVIGALLPLPKTLPKKPSAAPPLVAKPRHAAEKPDGVHDPAGSSGGPLAKRVEGRGLLAVFKDGAGAAVQEILSGHDAAKDIAQALDGASTTNVAGPMGSDRRGDAVGREVGIGELGTGGAAGEKGVLGERGGGEGPPVLVPEPPVIDPGGSCDPARIASEVKRRLGGVQACYDRVIKRRTDIAGRLVVHFEIDPDGRVEEAEIEESTMSEAALSSCVLANVRLWRFPKTAGGCAVSHPFVFTAAR